MSSTAVKCLRWGVLECVKSKTHDECALGRDERVSECGCVREGLTVVNWVVCGERVRTGRN